MLGQVGAIQKGDGIKTVIFAVVSPKVLINSLGNLFKSCIEYLLYTRHLGRCFMINVVFPYIVITTAGGREEGKNRHFKKYN